MWHVASELLQTYIFNLLYTPRLWNKLSRYGKIQKIGQFFIYPPVNVNRSVKTFLYYSHSNWYLYQR